MKLRNNCSSHHLITHTDHIKRRHTLQNVRHLSRFWHLWFKLFQKWESLENIRKYKDTIKGYNDNVINWVLKQTRKVFVSSHYHKTVTSNFSPVLNFSLDFLLKYNFKLLFYILLVSNTYKRFSSFKCLFGARSLRHSALSNGHSTSA